MRPKPLIAAFLLIPLAAAGQVRFLAPQIQTLSDAFALALKNSESIAASAQTLREAEALYRAGLGSSFPELSFRARTSWEDAGARTSRSGPPESDGALRLSKLGLSGYRELAILKAGKSDVGRRGFELERAKQLLLGDVAGAYFGLLQSRENVSSTKQLIELAERRLKELKERVRVGRAREADAVGQEFQAASLQSQLVELSRQVEARSDLLGYLARAEVSDAAKDRKILPKTRSLEDYLSRLAERPDVGAARQAAAATKAEVMINQANRLPALDLQANYYPYRRPASRAEVRWDASLTMGIPLWSWGARSATVEAAQAASHRQEQELQSVRRQADLEIRNAYRDYASARSQLDLRRRAVELARRDNNLQAKDERRGLVTSLEALESLNRLNGAELAFNSAWLGARLARLTLDITAGTKPEEMDLLK